jgi:hypothetical protein
MKEQSIRRFSEHLFLFSAIAFSVGLSTSKIILSISSMLMVLSVLLLGSYNTIPGRIKSARVLHPLLFFLALHITGLLWTSDFGFAGNDLKTKLTLLIVPVAFILHPLSTKKTGLILHFFVAAVLLTSLINMLAWHQVFGKRTYTDIRELSLFGSHIRYGILVAIAAAVCMFQIKQTSKLLKILFVLITCWFAYYTYFSQIVSGLLAFIVGLLAFLFTLSYERSSWLAYSIIGIPAIVMAFIAVYLSALTLTNEPRPEIFKNLPARTINGNPYTHNLEHGTFIDGKPTLAYLCEEELRSSWNAVSEKPYDGTDKKGQPVRFTLMRFLTDLGERKDSVGFLKLTRHDIALIESGIASREEGKGGLFARWKGIRFQLQNNIDPNGHSLLQRLEYWKTALRIIEKNWLIGVGTGDLQKSFDEQYTEDQSKLLPEYRLRAHNSYLTAWLSFGIAGLVLFFWIIIRFLKHCFQRKHLIGFTFMLVAAATFLLEDTLETQMGASFFAFFYGLFLSEETTVS